MQDTEAFFQDRFTIENIKKDNMFLKVNRIIASDESKQSVVELDVNCELYPMEKDQSYMITLTGTLGDVTENKGTFVPEKADREIKYNNHT